jgi:hypothetical protein
MPRPAMQYVRKRQFDDLPQIQPSTPVRTRALGSDELLRQFLPLSLEMAAHLAYHACHQDPPQ